MDPTPTRCVRWMGVDGTLGARLGGKLVMSVPSRSSSTVSLPCGAGCACVCVCVRVRARACVCVWEGG